ncbi:MAG: rod shape-determining protein MreC [Akkermansiaceae bacterium]|nr:rod shape-determining protein MreC [Armatimonadota bacterium]
MPPTSRRSERAKTNTSGRVNPFRGGGNSSPLLSGGVTRGGATPQRSGRTAFIALGVLVLTGVLYGILHNRLASAGRTDPALDGVRTVASPFAIGTSRASRSAKTLWDYILPGKRDTDTIARLESDNSRLKLENERLRNADADATRLRKALDFAELSPKPLLSAEIIALLPSANAETLLVSRGTNDGVKVGSVARTADGLLGQVTEVGSNTAQVLLLSDNSSGVGVLVQRRDPKTGGVKDRAVAVVRGRGRGQQLTVVYLRREDDIRVGDTVISSGFGGIIPAGVPIGTITEIVTEKTGFVKSARVEPFAPLPGTLREVFLIR